MPRILLPLFTGSALALACGSMGEGEGRASDVFTEHRFLAAEKAGKKKKKLGASCAEGGPLSCESNTCIHYLAGPSEGWACTVRCGEGEPPCPKGWRCEAIHPDAQSRVCFPPRDFKVKP